MNNKEEKPVYDPVTGKNEFGYTEAETEEALIKSQISHKKDYDGSRRLYADSVSTSEVLKKRAAASKASTNGHVDLVRSIPKWPLVRPYDG